MIDIVALKLSPETIRQISIIALWASAFFIGFTAFAATGGAGFRCPLALIRTVQRVFLAIFSIALAYMAVWLDVHDDFIPPGPALIVNVLMVFAFLPSVVRHAFAPPVPRSNTWRSVGAKMREAARRDGLGAMVRRIFEHHGHPQDFRGPLVPER